MPLSRALVSLAHRADLSSRLPGRDFAAEETRGCGGERAASAIGVTDARDAGSASQSCRPAGARVGGRPRISILRFCHLGNDSPPS